ncbi:carbon-nitrogen hydrolase family protein [Amphritea sp. 2_MG-2023]|uniref:carbon-nitrogen hydrolase family protein n=1 Tax=Amphritea TaxID=515417 RepID=UPI001C078B47|nr:MULTISPECIES: carbon-nitrogen hydrolase family protein [Amphritea]MBU2967313.1 carbon-nitrogen hydrolase family protein [Amphritea atlantica]MDO6420461.1 carbon-nitrogen hydrolase family protein [Amphritea sp. 2_MG-2023]
MKDLKAFKAAVCHVSPIYFDLQATMDKACSLIAEAARNGASLVAFPEAFLCAFPVWSGLRSPVENHDFFTSMVKSTVTVPGPEIARLCAMARDYSIVISMGLNESAIQSVGCIWDTNIIIDANGRLLNRHRKLVPTYWEKLTWANGDGSGLRVVDSEVGRIGALVCGENTNPLARYSLIAQGEQVHIASYSPRWPTHPASSDGGYDLEAAIRIRSGAHAFEAKAFCLVASGFLSDAAADLICRDEPAARELLESTPRSVSMIIGPSGKVISDTLQDEEGIIYADIDLNDCIEPKQFHDVSGGYNRFDVFDLRVNNKPLNPVSFGDSSSQAWIEALQPTEETINE